MGRFLDAAEKALKKAKRPLSFRELTDIALENKWLETKGKTPWHTMKSKLSTDILVNKDKSRFIRTSKGRFGLRSWLKNLDEQAYTARRFVKGPLQEEILVFPANRLSHYVTGRGLHIRAQRDVEDLLSSCQPMQRLIAEKDYTLIQPISVFVVKFNDKYLTYKRTKRLPEERLHDTYSMIFGGHLIAIEQLQFDFAQPQDMTTLFLRELREELKLPNQDPVIIYKGLLYDDSQLLSTQHIGIVFDVFLKTPEYEIGERGFLMNPKFETLEQIEFRINEFENWSVLIAQHERITGHK